MWSFFICLIPVQLPSGFVHWTVAVIPLVSVIAVLCCVIGFLLWRLKWRTRKQNGEITVNAIQYDAQTRSILNQDGQANNLRGVNQMRVHFQEPSNHDAPKYHTLQQATNNHVQYAALYKNPGELPIPRRLAIRRKDSGKVQSKYPLNRSRNEDETPGSCLETSSQGDGSERLSHEYHVLASDYDEPHGIIDNDHGNIEKPDCSDDELSYLEIIP